MKYNSDFDYIEMDESVVDESEQLYSDVDGKSLHLIANILGPDIRDKLLVPVVDDVRLHNRRDKCAI